MKKIILLPLFLWALLATHAQWSNTSNQFYDSLHMPVSVVTKDQSNSIVLRSYPDSGYFVIWEDNRNNIFFGIYAQKYDKNGTRLWVDGGVAVSVGTDDKTFIRTGNYDYRDYNYACTDSSDGFYLAFMDWNISNTGVTNKQRVCVQHMRNNGTAVFPTTGYIVADPGLTENFACGLPQLIADGNKGFFVGYIKENHHDLGGVLGRDLYVYDFIDENGVMKRMGGGKMDRDEVQTYVNSICLGPNRRSEIAVIEDFVQEYYLYSNLQKGCNITWIFSRNIGPPLSKTRHNHNRID